MSNSQNSTLPWNETKDQSISSQISAGVHFFILADIFVFSGIFIDFMLKRSQDLETFNQSAALLNPWSGIINTLILITSGFFVVLAFNAGKAGKVADMRRWVLFAIVIGAGFAVSKGFEYSGKIADGLTMHSNEFFMFYYTLTGAHFLHFIGGMIALSAIFHKSKKEVIDEKFLGNFKSVALYWHMVDFLWISIFPLLYLLGA
jgi:nitric oxide reductase NorE protein